MFRDELCRVRGGEDGVHVDLDGVCYVASVAAGEGDGDGDAPLRCAPFLRQGPSFLRASRQGGKSSSDLPEDEGVAPAEAIHGESEATELVFAVGVGAGDIEDEIGVEFSEGAREVRVEDGEIVFVTDAVGEIGVEIRGRLRFGVIVFLVDGKSEDGGIAGEDGGGAVALMDVGVNDHGGLDGAVGLQAANGDGDVVDDAEAFAVIGKSVVKAAAEVRSGSGGEGALSCFDGAAGGEPDGFDEFFGVRDFHAEDFVWSEGAGFEFADVGGSVDAEDVVVGGGLGRDDLGKRDVAGVDEGVANEAVFLRRENVGAEMEVVAVVVDERKHRLSG
jgi:hypothetical protein